MKRVAFSNAFNADFKEEKHKRDKDGKFSKSGSGGSSSKLLSAKTAEEQSKLKGEVNKVVKKIKGLNIRPLNLRG